MPLEHGFNTASRVASDECGAYVSRCQPVQQINAAFVKLACKRVFILPLTQNLFGPFALCAGHLRQCLKDRDIAQAEVETQQLRSVLSQVQKFEARKAQLQQRVTLIEQLRRGQTGPVHMLDEISRALPEQLWLTQMTQKGQDITLAGMTTSLTGVSDLVANLESSSWFKKPVDIIDSEMSSDPKRGDLVKFSVKATINNPDAPPPPAAPKK